MITAERKFPKSVRKILILGAPGAEPAEVELGMTAEEFRTRKVSKVFRPFEAEMRASAQAGQRYYAKYLELHDVSNEEDKDGSIGRLARNVWTARKAAWKTLAKTSPLLKRQKKFYRRFSLF